MDYIQALQGLLTVMSEGNTVKANSSCKVDIVLTRLGGFVPQITMGSKKWPDFKLWTIYLKEDALQLDSRDMN